MERNENIAQEALKYLDNAQVLEENGKLEEMLCVGSFTLKRRLITRW